MKTPATVILSLLALLTWGEFLSNIVWNAAFIMPWRQPGIWVAARLAIDGRPDLMYAATGPFQEEAVRLGANPDIFTTDAPTTIIPYLLIAPLDVNTARALWVIFNLVCFLAAWSILLMVLRLPLIGALALTALVPLFQPWRRNIFLGEDYGPMLLFIIMGSVLAVQPDAIRRNTGRIAAGLAFALAAIVRQFYGLAQLMAPFVRRQWGIVASTLGFYGVAALATLIWLGPQTWAASLRANFGWRENPETAVTAYQSLNNLITHLFRYDPKWNPSPLVDLPQVVGPLWALLAFAVIATSMWAIWHSSHQPEETPAQKILPYTLAVPVALLVAPLSEDYHYTLILFPLIVVGTILWEIREQPIKKQWLKWTILAASVILLAVPWRFYNVPDTGGWNAFLYYPRLYGNLLLWGLSLTLIMDRARQAAPLVTC